MSEALSKPYPYLRGHGAATKRSDPGVRTLLMLAFIWGLAVSFAQATPSPRVVYGVVLMACWCFLMLRFLVRRESSRRLHSGTIVVVGLHSLFSVISGILNHSTFADTLRFAMLVPAVMVLALAGSEQDSEKPTEALRLGLTLSIIPFVAYHLARSDWNRLLDPAYRPVFFLNANGTGFVAAVAFLSFWDYGCTGRRRLWNVTAFAMALACALLVIFTKSRTGLVCLVAPLLAYLALRFRSKSAVAGLVLLLVVLLVPDVGSRLLEIWAPANRPLGTLAGRDQVWYYLIDELIPQNWLIGVGPGHVGGYTQAYVGRSGAHNAWFLYMSEVGLLGTLPLVLCVITTAIAALRTYTGPANHIWHAVFLSGLLHGLAEQGLFSMGNFGGLMFILAVMTLNRRGLAVAGNAQGYKR